MWAQRATLFWRRQVTRLPVNTPYYTFFVANNIIVLLVVGEKKLKNLFLSHSLPEQYYNNINTLSLKQHNKATQYNSIPTRESSEPQQYNNNKSFWGPFRELEGIKQQWRYSRGRRRGSSSRWVFIALYYYIGRCMLVHWAIGVRTQKTRICEII